MYNQILNFLENKRSEHSYNTHVSIHSPRGNFVFSKKEVYEEFWKLYCDELSLNRDFKIGLAEKPLLYMPVRVDIDIKIDISDGELLVLDYNDHLYTENSVKEVICIYQHVLENIVEDWDVDYATCVLLEKPMYTTTQGDKQYLKSGFHLHFPSCFLRKEDQMNHLLPRVEKLVKQRRVFHNLGFEDSSEVLDKNICSVNWLVYGATKSPESLPYKVTKVYNSKCEEVTLDEAFKNYMLYDNREHFIDTRGKIEYYLPRILSILPYGRETLELKENLENCLGNDKSRHCSRPVNNDSVVSYNTDLSTVKKLLDMISDSRADIYYDWMNIGWSLFSIGNGSSEAFELWNSFSKRSSKYDEDACISAWEKMVKKDKTIRTFYYLAKIDSPEQYEKFKNEGNSEAVVKSLKGTHNSIARLLYMEYGTEFVCANSTSGTWFQFKNHRWNDIDGGVYLRKRLSTNIADMFKKISKDLYVDRDAYDKEDRDILDKKRLRVEKICENLESRPFKVNVMKEAADEFYDEGFSAKLNQDSYLFLFKNGVYDLRNHIFRDGQPDDYLSRSCPINYREFRMDEPIVKEVQLFFMKVFPDEELREYFLDQMSQIFIGGNLQKKVVFWTGEGDNSKSVTLTLFEKMLGSYSIKFKTTLFTGKKSGSTEASPDLARAGDGVRLGVFQEPSAKEEINVGTLKELSGNDSYWARDLYESGKATREIFPKFKIIGICNELPEMPFADKAVWNRVRVIPFESTFVLPGSVDHKPPPESLEEQFKEKRFPAENDFEKKIPDMLEPLAFILLERLKTLTYKPEPLKVLQATEIYKKNNDIYRQFIEEQISENCSSMVSMDDIYTSFRNWFKEGFTGKACPPKNSVRDYLCKVWGPADNRVRWHGYKIRSLDEELLEGTAMLVSGSTGKYVSSIISVESSE